MQHPPVNAHARLEQLIIEHGSGALPSEVALVVIAGRPVYQRIAAKAQHLRELGLSDRVIAARLGVSDKTIAKAIRWLRRTGSWSYWTPRDGWSGISFRAVFSNCRG